MTLPPENTIGIYKITSPSGRVYIGQSVDIKNRWNQYKRGYSKDQPKLHNSFKKYGVNKHQFEILTTCSFDELNEYERYYQELYNVIDNGLNCQLVSTNAQKQVQSEETRRKISEANKGNKNWLGRKHTEDTKALLSIVNRNPSNETRRKISEVNKGNKYCLNRHVSIKTRRKISEANKGIQKPKKIINVITPKGDFLNDGIINLSKQLDISPITIRKLLKGGTSEKYAGWTFKYT